MPVTSLEGTNLCPLSVNVGSSKRSIGSVASWTTVLASMVVLAVANFT